MPGLGVNYLICVTGQYPPTTGSGALPAQQPFVGQVVAFAGTRPPAGWAICDGALLQIEDFEILFVLILNTYGGDGVSTFALPDLRGRVIVGN